MRLLVRLGSRTTSRNRFFAPDWRRPNAASGGTIALVQMRILPAALGSGFVPLGRNPDSTAPPFFDERVTLTAPFYDMDASLPGNAACCRAFRRPPVDRFPLHVTHAARDLHSNPFRQGSYHDVSEEREHRMTDTIFRVSFSFLHYIASHSPCPRSTDRLIAVARLDGIRTWVLIGLVGYTRQPKSATATVRSSCGDDACNFLDNAWDSARRKTDGPPSRTAHSVFLMTKVHAWTSATFPCALEESLLGCAPTT